MASGHMTKDEREAFLAAVRVGILAIDEPGRGPCALPIWYSYEDGVVTVSIDRTSLKGRLAEAAGRATLTVQTETAPYQYVSVEGPVELDASEGDVLSMATRYLGAEFGKWYADANPPNEHTVQLRLRPEHWRTFDFNKV